MVYDRDLKFTARMILVLLAGNVAGGIHAAVDHAWVNCFGFAIWSVNILMWRRMNQNFQRQRDRNREIEAAMLKVLAGDRY